MAEVQSRAGDDVDGGEQFLAERRHAFAEWRAERPFAGGVLLMFAGLLISWVPMNMAVDLLLLSTPVTYIGLLFALLVFLTGAFALRLPEYSREFGVLGMALSILSLFGALGGLFVGMLIGIAGGNLCYAWNDPRSDDGT